MTRGTMEEGHPGSSAAGDPVVPGTGSEVAAGGLRERSKARRRRDIQKAAMELFAAQGYDATTVAEIAAKAEVAPRTVSGYFPSKVEIATSVAEDLVGRLLATYAQHPGKDAVSVLEVWLRNEEEDLDPELGRLAFAAYHANPRIWALGNDRLGEVANRGVQATARMLGRDPDDPIVEICQKACGVAVGGYFKALWQGRASPELRAEVIGLMRGLMATAKG